MRHFNVFIALLLVLIVSGCASTRTAMDYSAFKQSNPKSILVLPPINHSTEVIAPYAVLSTVTVPLAEAGYYVFPVALVDETFKNNGLTVAEDIHALSPTKLHDIFAADAVMYLEVEQYGTSYAILSSDTVVTVKAKLVDSRTQTVLWQGQASAASSEENNGNSGGIVGMLVEAAVTQIMETVLDTGFDIAGVASARLLSAGTPNGLLYGPRSPKHGKEQAQ